MGLQADLTVKLDVSGPQGSFTADFSGVLDTLAGIDLPLDPEAVEGIVSVAGSLDLANLNVSAEALGKQILEVAGHLPIAGDLLGTIIGIIEIAERFAEPNLETAVTGLIDRISLELDNLEGGALGAFTRVGVLLKSAPEINLLQGLYGIFVQHGAPALGEITLAGNPAGARRRGAHARRADEPGGEARGGRAHRGFGVRPARSRSAARARSGAARADRCARRDRRGHRRSMTWRPSR